MGPPHFAEARGISEWISFPADALCARESLEKEEEM
jgi:hypothetical protein